METPKGTDRSAGSVSADASTCDSVFQLTPVRLLRRRCKHLRRRWRSAPAPSGKTYDIRRATPSPIGLSTSFGLRAAISGVPSTNRPHRSGRGCGRPSSSLRGWALARGANDRPPGLPERPDPCSRCKVEADLTDGLHPLQRPSPRWSANARCCHGVQIAVSTGRRPGGRASRPAAGGSPGTRKCPKEPPVRFGATGASTCVARAPVFRPLRARPTVTAGRSQPLPGYPRVWRSEGPIRAPCPPPVHHGPRADAIRWPRRPASRSRSRRRPRPRCGRGATPGRTIRR